MKQVERQDGTKVSYKGFKNVKHYELDYETYSEIPEVYVQRNTEGRLAKRSKQFSTLIEEHIVVHLAKLTEDDEVKGIKYKAGSIFKLDSCTRSLNWKRGGSDNIPKKLIVIEYSFPTMERIKQSYDTFDSTDATEKNQEKVYGILQGVFGFTPKSTKIIKGQILSALNKACNFYYPNIWKTYGEINIKEDGLSGQIGAFIDEIKHLDPYIKNPSNWDQALVCSGLMAIKRYGTNCDEINEALFQIDERTYDNRSSTKGGLDHICYEWDTKKIFPEKVTSWDKECGLDNCVSYTLYWIDKHLNKEKQKKLGNNWRNYGKTYKDMFQPSQQINILNAAFNVETV